MSWAGTKRQQSSDNRGHQYWKATHKKTPPMNGGVFERGRVVLRASDWPPEPVYLAIGLPATGY